MKNIIKTSFYPILSFFNPFSPDLTLYFVGRPRGEWIRGLWENRLRTSGRSEGGGGGGGEGGGEEGVEEEVEEDQSATATAS